VRNAVYVASDAGHVVGIVGADAVDGPLTLRVAGLAPVLTALPRTEEIPAWATGEGLGLGGTVWIAWAGARRWAPAVPRVTGTPVACQPAAQALIPTLAAQAGDKGRGRLAADLPALLAGGAPSAAIQGDPVLRGIAAGLQALHAAWRAADADAASAALVGLLGLGPGLTPSGDDVVCGILSGLVWQTGADSPQGPLVAALAQAVNAAAGTRTNRISTALLRHAATGLLYAPAMDLGAALLAGSPAAVADPVRRLLAIGHTSGGDLAVGVLFAVCIMSM
jgi:uncharacterized protein DUF2877